MRTTREQRDAINAKLDAEMATNAALREELSRLRLEKDPLVCARDALAVGIAERDAAIARAEAAERRIAQLSTLLEYIRDGWIAGPGCLAFLDGMSRIDAAMSGGAQ